MIKRAPRHARPPLGAIVNVFLDEPPLTPVGYSYYAAAKLAIEGISGTLRRSLPLASRWLS